MNVKATTALRSCLALATTGAACAGGAPPPRVARPGRVAGPAQMPPRLEQIVQDEASAYRDAAVFPDERALLGDPRCRIEVEPAPRALVTDAEAKRACATRTGERGEACRRACLVAARVAIAPLLQRELFAGVAAFPDAFAAPEHASCRGLVERGGNQIYGPIARELWACLGLGALPERVDLVVQFATSGHDRRVTYLAATASMLPGAAKRSFAIGDAVRCAAGPCVSTTEDGR